MVHVIAAQPYIDHLAQYLPAPVFAGLRSLGFRQTLTREPSSFDSYVGMVTQGEYARVYQRFNFAPQQADLVRRSLQILNGSSPLGKKTAAAVKTGRIFVWEDSARLATPNLDASSSFAARGILFRRIYPLQFPSLRDFLATLSLRVARPTQFHPEQLDLEALTTALLMVHEMAHLHHRTPTEEIPEIEEEIFLVPFGLTRRRR